jgi:hypothetical protein
MNRMLLRFEAPPGAGEDFAGPLPFRSSSTRLRGSLMQIDHAEEALMSVLMLIAAAAVLHTVGSALVVLSLPGAAL